MKKLLLLILMILVLAALASGCTPTGSSQESSQSISSTEADLIRDRYIDPSELTAPSQEPDQVCTAEDRTLILEDTPENQLEAQVYGWYLDLTQADFESLMTRVGEDESLRIAAENEEKNFQEGLYMTEYTLHSLTTLTADDMDSVAEYHRKALETQIRELDLQEYAVVCADLSWKHNEAALQQVPQLGDGRYLRYWMLGTSGGSDEFLLQEVFWDDFLPAD